MYLVPFGILSRHFASRNQELLKKDTLSYLESRAKNLSGAVSNALENSYYAVSGTINSRQFLDSDWSKRKLMLENVLRESPGIYLRFELINAEGRKTASAGKAGGPADEKKSDYSKDEIFTQSMAGGISMGRVLQGQSSPPSLIVGESLLRGDEKRPLGVVVTWMSLSCLNEIVNTSRKSFEEGDEGIIDADGMLIADSRGISVISPGAGISEEISALIRKAEDSGLDTAKGESHAKKESGKLLAAVSAVEGTRWWVFEREPSSVIRGYASVFWARRVIVSGILLILVLSVITERLAGVMFRSKGP